MAVNLDKSLMGSNSADLTTGIDKLSELIKTSIDTARKPASDLAPLLTTKPETFIGKTLPELVDDLYPNIELNIIESSVCLWFRKEENSTTTLL